MAKFTVNLTGKAEADAVRLAWENLIQSVRDAADAIELEGELLVDDIPYAIGDVPEPLPPEEAVDTEDGEAVDPYDPTPHLAHPTSEEDHGQDATTEETEQ